MVIAINKTEFTVINFVDQNKKSDVKTSPVFKSITQGLTYIWFTNDLFHLTIYSAKKISITFLATNKEAFEFRGINNSSDLFRNIASSYIINSGAISSYL